MFQKIPTVTKFLLIANILIFLITTFSGVDSRGSYVLNEIFGLHFFLSSDFHIYQLVTYMFMHGGWEHLFFNMFALWMFGCVVERVWGPQKFLFYYIACGIGAGLFQEAAQLGQFYMMASDQIAEFGVTAVVRANAAGLSNWTTVGASGAIYAILLAFGMIFPEERIFIFPLPIPIKAKWFVIFYAGLELFLAISTTGDGVAHIAHLGGMVFGFFMIRYWRKHPTAGYGKSQGEQFFENLRSSWEKRSKKSADKASWGGSRTSTGNPDWDYNARKQREQEEIDRILDKIRKNGYDSLTSEEKRKLFEQSKKG
ncbi:MAG: rhomboid family intramembrane serine protease [Prevotella sp.]|nr:rhomboid family intramembrane serine protease [Prevotella sp.]MBR6493950.1 rhomboid family intramembrane serine protease [Prevotella sp.]